jgi:hypothetical protein
LEGQRVALEREKCLERELAVREVRERFEAEVEELRRELAAVVGLRTAERVQPEPESDTYVELQVFTEAPTYREPLLERDTNSIFFVPTCREQTFRSR